MVACVQDGPCSYLSHTLPLTFPTSTGCIAALEQCSTTLTVTLPANCTQGPQPPYPSVLMLAGYQVPTRYYHSLAESLAANGYAVIQVTARFHVRPCLQANSICCDNRSKMSQA